jgi:hypothetical protein
MGPMLRVLALLAAAALLAACGSANLLYSNVAFAYSNATPMIAWAVDDYVDMSDAQKAWVRERLGQVLAWHRQRELPEYRRFLDGVERNLEGGFTEAEVRDAHRDVREHYHRLVEQVLPHAAEFLLQLDAEQLAQLERKFAESNHKVAKEAGRDAEERRAKGIRRTIEHLEAWVGRLDPAQRELAAAHLRGLPDLSAERMADRRYRQAQALALIRAKPERAALAGGLRRLLVETEAWRPPAYQEKLRERDAANFRMVSALSATLSPEQRAQLVKRLRGFMADIASVKGST